jgi:hypothetical protein
VHTTFFGAKDNCPPGGIIAYPIIHKVAGECQSQWVHSTQVPCRGVVHGFRVLPPAVRPSAPSAPSAACRPDGT